MFIVYYTVQIVYVCVFVTCSTFYCLCDTLTDPWNMYVRLCARVHAPVYVRGGVCLCVRARARGQACVRACVHLAVLKPKLLLHLWW